MEVEGVARSAKAVKPTLWGKANAMFDTPYVNLDPHLNMVLGAFPLLNRLNPKLLPDKAKRELSGELIRRTGVSLRGHRDTSGRGTAVFSTVCGV